MSERQLWKWLSAGPLPAEGFYSRIESPDTSPGIPDVYYRLPVASGWLELKFDRRPKSNKPFLNEDDGLHLSQRVWIQEAIDRSDIVFVVAAMSNKTVLWLDMLDVRPDHFNSMDRTALHKKARLILPKPIYRRDLAEYERKIRHLLIDG